MAHGENLHILIFGEDADSAESLANLPGKTGHMLQLDHVSEAGKLETALETVVPDILVCSARQTSPAFANTQSMLAARNPEFPVITITDILPEGNMAEATLAGPAQLFAYDRPDEIRQPFTRATETLGSRSNQPQLLNHLPVDFLKIDGSLINNLAAKQESQAQVKAVVSLACKHGEKCIAEQVEEAGDLAPLWQNGVDIIPGNFVQEPGRHPSYDLEGEIA